MRVLVTFDIDGTLMICGRNGQTHRDAFRMTIRDICGVDQEVTEFLDVPLAGVSDSYIASCVARKINPGADTDPKWISDFVARVETYFVDNFDGTLDLMPGVVGALRALAEMPEVTLGVCSGNFPRIGRKKLESAGLSEFFSAGIAGWGMHQNRRDMLKSAIAQAEAQIGGKFDHIIHVGDAPQDVQAAIDNGAIGVAVLTSRHPFKESDFPKPCFVLKNLDVEKERFLEIVKNGVE